MVSIPKLIENKPNYVVIELDLLTFYYSYNTLIAVETPNKLFISDNEWSSTTGKHLNSINPNKNIRIPHKELLKQVKELIII